MLVGGCLHGWGGNLYGVCVSWGCGGWMGRGGLVGG